MELLVVNHKDFTLKVECVKFDAIYGKARRNMGSDEKLLSYYRWTDGVIDVHVGNDELENGANAKAVFFDNADYPVWVDFRDEAGVSGPSSTMHSAMWPRISITTARKMFFRASSTMATR